MSEQKVLHYIYEGEPYVIHANPKASMRTLIRALSKRHRVDVRSILLEDADGVLRGCNRLKPAIDLFAMHSRFTPHLLVSVPGRRLEYRVAYEEGMTPRDLFRKFQGHFKRQISAMRCTWNDRALSTGERIPCDATKTGVIKLTELAETTTAIEMLKSVQNLSLAFWPPSETSKIKE